MADYLNENVFKILILNSNLNYRCCIKIELTFAKEFIFAKSNNSKECMICQYCFFNHGFRFQDYVCNGCHGLTMLNVNISNIAIITVKNVNYRCIIHNISKSEAINLLRNSVKKFST